MGREQAVQKKELDALVGAVVRGDTDAGVLTDRFALARAGEALEQARAAYAVIEELAVASCGEQGMSVRGTAAALGLTKTRVGMVRQASENADSATSADAQRPAVQQAIEDAVSWGQARAGALLR